MEKHSRKPKWLHIKIIQAHLREIYKYFFILLNILTSGDIVWLQVISNVSFAFAIFTFIVDAYLIIEEFRKRGIHDQLAHTIVIDLNYHFDHSIIHDSYEETYFFKTKNK